MRIHRIYTHQSLVPEATAELKDGAAHYLSRVLRIACGQQVVLFNGDGTDYVAEIQNVDRHSITLAVRSRLPAKPESPLNLTLVQSISRGERMDFSLQKATELGVWRVQPVFSRRSEVRLKPEKLERRMQHWQRLLQSACEQCGRAVVPVLEPPVDVVIWGKRMSGAQRLALIPGSKRGLAGIPISSPVELLVGPEGGFDETEWGSLEACGVQPVSLGPRILRTETAGPAAIAVLQAKAGDLA